MSIETGLRPLLTNDAGVSALVATSDSPPRYRIYPMRLPQGYVLDAISYQRVSAERRHDITDGPIGWAFSRFQFDCWSGSYSGARDLAEALRQALDGYSGDLSDGTHVGGIYIEGERDLFEEDTEIYRVSMDFLIPYKETP